MMLYCNGDFNGKGQPALVVRMFTQQLCEYDLAASFSMGSRQGREFASKMAFEYFMQGLIPNLYNNFKA